MDVERVYERVLAVANHFLVHAHYLSIDALRKLNPTVEEFASDLRLLALIIRELAGESFEDEDMAINAFQCCLVMERIAKVVKSGEEPELERLVKELEGHASAPVPSKKLA